MNRIIKWYNFQLCMLEQVQCLYSVYNISLRVNPNHSVRVFKYIVFRYTQKYLNTLYKYIKFKVFTNTLMNTQMYLNTTELWFLNTLPKIWYYISEHITLRRINSILCPRYHATGQLWTSYPRPKVDSPLLPQNLVLLRPHLFSSTWLYISNYQPGKRVTVQMHLTIL